MNNKAYRILHISSNAGSLYSHMVETEKKLGCNPFFFNYSLRQKKEYETIKVSKDNLHIFRLKSKCKGPLLYLNRLLRVSHYILPLINEVDFSYAHMLFSDGIIARKIWKEKGIPYIVSIRNTDLNLWFYWKLPWIKKQGMEVLKDAKYVLFLSESYRIQFLHKLPNRIREIINKKCIVLPNGIDEFWRNNAVIEPRSCCGNPVRLLSIGRIEQNKNQTAVLDAMSILKTRGIRSLYTVIGESKDALMTKKLQSNEDVRIVGFKPKEEQIKYYNEADIFVLPSITETFGLVYAEALTQAIPVIYSKNQGFDKQFEDGVVGYSVSSFDPVDIADAIEMIRINYSSLSQRCSVSWERFDWVKIVEKYIALMTEQNMNVRGEEYAK